MDPRSRLGKAQAVGGAEARMPLDGGADGARG